MNVEAQLQVTDGGMGGGEQGTASADDTQHAGSKGRKRNRMVAGGHVASREDCLFLGRARS